MANPLQKYIEAVPDIVAKVEQALKLVKKAAKINLSKLTDGLICIPSTHIEVSEVSWLVRANHTNIRNRRKLLEVEYAELVRTDPGAYIPNFNGGRVTNAMIDEQVAQMRPIVDAKELEAEYDELIHKTDDMKTTLEYASRTLSRLESLHGQGYWSN